MQNLPRLFKRFPVFNLGKFMSTKSRTFEEIQIPVPWGHIAGKWWGSKDKRPILCIHGWQDNCGTFDPLVQHLPSCVPFLTIDLPGHGLSSQIPSGLFYNGFDLVILLRRIMNYFNWSKLSLMGHSLGGITSYLYATTFPNMVDFVICFDTATPMTEIGGHVNCTPEIIDKFLFYDEANCSNKEPPSYPYENLEKILHKGSGESVDLDKCKYLIARNVKQSKVDTSKYYFTRDPRVKCQFFMAWFYKKLVKDGSKFKNPAMEIEAVYDFRENWNPFLYNEIMDIFKENNENFQLYKFKGTHHFHLNNSAKVSEILNPFIEKYFSGDQ
ncbi:probable serine hydrolase [Agrilus planipennis]|uniref:Probable serine hydrolase n=1 Tax=Agrilus planipennis TaxID=224129 RepID=A0A1W4X153_AGRPL|nr:probable serine hydrolase [Agrilus planipennis]